MSINLLQAVNELKNQERDSLTFKISKGNSDAEHYVLISTLVDNAMESSDTIQKGLDIVEDRLGGEKYTPEHFGRVGYVPMGKVFSNLDIQRHIEVSHIGSNILPILDPRITQPINVVYHKEQDIYTAWDGQQTASTIYSLLKYGLIDLDNWEEFPLKANIIDADLTVPGSNITGEAVANFGFRTINGTKAKKPVDPYYVMRSEHNGVRLYDSDLQEDVHSNQMWTTMEKHNMLPAATVGTDKKLPGHIAHISGMKSMAGHDSNTFDIKTFERVISFLSEYFNTDNGINSSFYMAIAELFELIKDQNLEMGFNQEQFAQFIKDEYSNGHGFSKYAKNRLYNLQDKLAVKRSWTDACSVPYLVDDYIRYCERNNLNQGLLPHPNRYQDYVNVVEKV